MGDLSRVLHVATDREYEEILRSVTEKLVVVDFHATWSGPCLAMSKVYQKFSREYLNCIFLKVDVTDHVKTANDCGIATVPTYQFYINGIKQAEFSGASEAKLRDMINRFQEPNL